MNLSNTIQQLKKIEAIAVDIVNSDMEAEYKYDLIFSEKISRKVFALFQDSPLRFDYYDPDTSYEEDIQAFVSALTEHTQRLDELYQSNQHIYDRLEKL